MQSVTFALSGLPVRFLESVRQGYWSLPLKSRGGDGAESVPIPAHTKTKKKNPTKNREKICLHLPPLPPLPVCWVHIVINLQVKEQLATLRSEMMGIKLSCLKHLVSNYLHSSLLVVEIFSRKLARCHVACPRLPACIWRTEFSDRGVGSRQVPSSK